MRTNNNLGALFLLIGITLQGATAEAQASDPFQWDMQCQDRGCMLFLDVLHGAAGQKTPPDPADSKQYISLMVAIDRTTRRPAYLALHFPPDADPKQGFFVGFASDEHTAEGWSVKPDHSGVLNLGFDSCNEDSCVARMREGKVEDGKGGLIDLLGRFDKADHLWLMYMKGHQQIRTSIPLGPYRSAYQRALTTGLAGNH